MSKPTKHYRAWRIRYVDEHGVRQSEVFPDHKQAVFELKQRELEVEERRRGLRPGPPLEKTFADLATYWKENRVPQKRSGHHDKSIIERRKRQAQTIGEAALKAEGQISLLKF